MTTLSWVNGFQLTTTNGNVRSTPGTSAAPLIVASTENTILHAIYVGDGGSKLYWSFCQAPAAPNDWAGNIQIFSEPGIVETSKGRPAVAAIPNGLMTLLAPQGDTCYVLQWNGGWFGNGLDLTGAGNGWTQPTMLFDGQNLHLLIVDAFNNLRWFQRLGNLGTFVSPKDPLTAQGTWPSMAMLGGVVHAIFWDPASKILNHLILTANPANPGVQFWASAPPLSDPALQTPLPNGGASLVSFAGKLFVIFVSGNEIFAAHFVSPNDPDPTKRSFITFDGPVTENSQVAKTTVPPSATVYQQNGQNEFLIVCHKGLTSGDLWIDVGVAI